MGKNIDVYENEIVGYSKEIFDILLMDRTTRHNIVWATDDYSDKGAQYRAQCEITPSLITGIFGKVICPRVEKEKHHQNIRTRNMAEVFTPSWICNAQNNLIDEQWFGRKDVFNYEADKTWIPISDKVEFPKKSKKTWKDYVDARRLEITCGEAPYLVSRYDTVTGEYIEVPHRIGLLDRKLRVINENTDNEKDWYIWTVRAFQSIYGYEFQGDSLLIARENLLYSFIDNLRYKFDREPTNKELKEIATIISWNIWQMDGLYFTVPYSGNYEDVDQVTLDDLFEGDSGLDLDKSASVCKIHDWRANKTIDFKSLLKGANDEFRI